MPKLRPTVDATESRLIFRMAAVGLTWAKIQRVGALERVADQLQKKAKVKKDVPLQKITAEAGVEACNRAVADALYEVDIYYRKLKERQVLKDEDLPYISSSRCNGHCSSHRR